MKSIKICVLFFCTLSISVISAAEEITSRDLYLSGGVGFHGTGLAFLLDDVTYSTQINKGILTSFKLGGYLTPNFAAYFQRQSVWWTYVNSIVVSDINGIGGTVYFNQNLMYFELGLGVGGLDVVDSGLTRKQTGSAFLIGYGIEATDNIQVGIVTLATSISDSENLSFEYETFTTAIKIEFKL